MTNAHLTDTEIQQLAQDAIAGIVLHPHLASCKTCSAKYALYQAFFTELERPDPPVIPAAFAGQVVQTIAAGKEQKRNVFNYRLASTVILLIALGGCAALLFNNSMHRTFAGGAGSSMVIMLAAVLFVYIAIWCYGRETAKEDLLADICF